MWLRLKNFYRRGGRVLLGTGAARMISATGSIVFGIMIGRLLGLEALGAFTFAISVVLVCVLVAKFGCDKVVTKQTAIEPKRNYKTQLYVKISRYLWRSFLFP